jgi:hypothetical protein
MAFSPVRRAPRLLMVLAVGCTLSFAGAARAGKNDLELINLCDSHPGAGLGGQAQECSWVTRGGTGLITAPVSVSQQGQSQFRSLMSELGVVIAPRLQTPADTLGYAGFNFSAELGFTKINSSRPYWRGVSSVDPTAPPVARSDSYLTTVGGFVRKGLWLPLPAFEFGAGAVNIVGSRMYALQGYAKIALQEGFHGWALPSLAVRGSVSQLLGTDQVSLNVFGVDVLVSKAFGLAGTARIEPFLGWNMLFIDAQSGVIDATPGCDAYAVKNAAAGGPAVSDHCAATQNGTFDDLKANFTFPQQDVITRQRWSGGFKLKLAVVFLVAEYDLIPAGTSHDERQADPSLNGRDESGRQQSFSLSAGFDF